MFCVVVASKVTRKNAALYVEQLHQRGIKDASVYIENDIVRVVYGMYATEAEALDSVRHIRDNEEFANAWIYKTHSNTKPI